MENPVKNVSKIRSFSLSLKKSSERPSLHKSLFVAFCCMVAILTAGKVYVRRGQGSVVAKNVCDSSGSCCCHAEDEAMSDNAVEEPTSAFHESGVEGFSPVVESFPAGAKACYRWIALVPLMVLLALPTLAPCAIASLVLWNDCSSLQWYLNPLPYVAGGNMVQIVSSDQSNWKLSRN